MTKDASRRVRYARVVTLAAAGVLWMGGSALFGWGFGIAFLGDPAPWKGAAAFALWGASSLMLGGALKLAGILTRKE